MTLLVSDILKRPFFENTKILAGRKGLNREVKWAHIVEIARFGHLLNGKEVILTTGIGWAHEDEKSLSYLQQLLDYNASALCIELVIHTKTLPKKMLELAEQHNFPIIIFTEEVKFIDITKDLHELLIGYHENIWWKLESLYNYLNKELISNGNIGDFLRILHKETSKQISLKYEDRYRFFPSPPKNKQQQLIRNINERKNNYYEQSIELFGNKIATLYLLDNKSNMTQFENLALKRCGEILGQYFWKNHLQKEANQNKRNEWIFEAIAGTLSHEEVTTKIHEKTPGILMKEALIAIKPSLKSLLVKERESHSETAVIMLLRPILLQHGFQLLTVRDFTRNNYILLLINQQSNDLQDRLEKALKTVYQNNHDPFIESEIQWISFGKVITTYNQLGKSYDTALSTLNYQQNIEKLQMPFYDTLAIYRLIDQMKDKEDLREIIIDYLGPLLTYDAEKGTELLKTLQIYFKNLGAKNETSGDLHIVRQTLYHRLNRIEELLGKDFMAPENRFMIEFSIHALKYVKI